MYSSLATFASIEAAAIQAADSTQQMK